MTSLETMLRQAYAAERVEVVDAQSLIDGARRRGRALRRRRQAIVVFAAALVVAAAGLAGTFLSESGANHGARVPAARFVMPAGPQLTVYEFATPAGQARVITYLDTRGRWCVGTVQPGATRPDSSETQCAEADLTPGASGFGRVATRADGFTYDGVNQWLQGVATADVARVTVAMTDGSIGVARLVHDDGGVVFSVRLSWLKIPAFYRAYDQHGRLIEQLRVPESLPHDPFVDWRLPAPTR